MIHNTLAAAQLTIPIFFEGNSTCLLCAGHRHYTTSLLNMPDRWPAERCLSATQAFLTGWRVTLFRICLLLKTSLITEVLQTLQAWLCKAGSTHLVIGRISWERLTFVALVWAAQLMAIFISPSSLRELSVVPSAKSGDWAFIGNFSKHALAEQQ
mmetsp:Transcript_12024/g.22462  ORF Transcript_12024/g.22462 Transcript_12024/m.22462 type:complete len:155 (-) Transcript_12024:7-471(-)